jgi:exopolysaccharide biosynthesis polyprenyl glycosylphosphotransferase
LSTTSDDMRAATRADSLEIVVSTSQASPDVDLTVGGAGSSATTSATTTSTTTANLPEADNATTTEAHPLIPTQSPERGAGSGWDADRDRRRFAAQRRHSWAAQRPYDLMTDSDVHGDVQGTVDPVALAHQRRAEWLRPLILRSAFGDALVAAGVMALACFSLPRLRAYSLGFAAGAAVVWVLAVLVSRGYESRRLGDGPEEFQSLLRAAFGVIAAMGVLAYSFEVLLPRRLVLIAVPLTALLSVVNRHLARKRLHSRRYDGQAMRRTLIVGEPTAVREVMADLAEVKHHGYEVVGACVPVPGPEIAENLGLGVLGGISEVPQVVVDNQIDSVIVVGAQLSGTPLRRLSWALEHTGADLVVAPGLVEVTGPNVTLRPSAGLSLLLVEPPSSRLGRMLLKSLLDRVIGIGLLVCAAPIIGIAALLVRLTSRGKAFFPQHRVGLDGSTFTMFKLRSMVADAEERKSELLDLTDRDGLMFKMHSDPRITAVGKVLRRFSIDELPQLWNVVKGDMSLVGPRPPLPSEYEAYHDAVHRRLRVRPGLTGLWQVSGRADLTWEESVRMDLRYVDNWSIALDLQILWKTARAVLRGSGAY